MHGAVAELLIVERGLLDPLLGFLGDALECLPLPLVVDHLLLQDLGGVGVLVEVVVELKLDEVDDKLLDRDAALGDLAAAELGLGLRLEDRLLDPDADGGGDAGADVVVVVVLVEEFLHRLADRLLEGRQMRPAVERILPVDKGVVLLAILRGVRDRHLDIVSLQMDDGIERCGSHIILEEIKETIPRDEAVAIEVNRQTRLEVGIHPDHAVDELLLVAVVSEDVRIGVVVHEGAVVLARCGQDLALLDELPLLEDDCLHRPVAVGGDSHTGGESVDRLEPDAIEPDRLLEDLVVVLGAGIHRTYSLSERALRDASAVVADGDVAVLLLVDRDVDVLAVPHRILVDGVVDHLL